MCDVTSSAISSSSSSLSFSSSSSSSSSTMGRSCVKIGVSMAVVCVLVYVTRHMYKPRYLQVGQQLNSNEHGRDGANDKTDAVIGQQQQFLHTKNKIFANGEGDNEEDSAFPFPDNSNNGEEYDDGEEDEQEDDEEVEAGRVQTYFSTMNVSFSDIPIGPYNSLPTLPFLEARQETTQLFEKLHEGILDRVVQYIRKNIKRIRRNYDLAPDKSNTLQEMITQELAREVRSLPKDQLESTSLFAVTWLKRTFEFISRFLSYIESGEEQKEAASKAYKETLIQYHGFAIRTIFQTAFYTLSTRSAFLRAIAVNESDVDLPGFEKTATDDLKKYTSALNRRLRLLESFFDEHGIGSGYID